MRQGMSALVHSWRKYTNFFCHSRFNATLSSARRLNLGGVYDPHTNVLHQPKIMQPTHVRWEQIPTADFSANGVDNLTNGVKGVSLNGHPTHNSHPNTIFSQPSASITQNFLVIDTVYESAPLPHTVIPGPDGDSLDIGTNGLANIPDDVADELPPDCRAAFDAAKAREIEWRERWTGEKNDALRSELKFGLSFYPN